MASEKSQRSYRIFLTVVSGMAGLLYGIDVGIIDPALPYLHKASGLSESQLSLVVAAVLAGSILGSVVAGVLADWLGRKRMMIVSALMFVGSVTLIYLSQSFVPLMLGRVLQGMSGGVIAVVVPLYLAECMPAEQRGRGMAVFQFMLTVGIVLAAVVGSHYVANAELAIQSAGDDLRQVLAAADHAWRSMYLMVIYPGILFLLGCVLLSESPRWLVRKGRRPQARAVLERLRPPAQCDAELGDIVAAVAADNARPRQTILASLAEMLTERRYVLPFVLACVILGCNQATGINSLLQFMSTILQKAGLDPVSAASYGTAIKVVNSLMTVVAIVLVERKGRVFLLKLGTSGIIVSLCLLALLFHQVEARRQDVRAEVAALVKGNRLDFNLADAGWAGNGASQLSIVYQYGEHQHVSEAFTPTARSGEVLRRADAVALAQPPVVRDSLLRAQSIWSGRNGADAGEVERIQRMVAGMAPADRAAIEAARRVRLAEHVRIEPDDASAARLPLQIVRAHIAPIPGENNGLLAALCIGAFIASFSVGPGVCVWLALSELMPTRIRSVGMGVALLINQGVGTLIAGAFLPIVGNFGFYMMFLFWAGCTLVYLVTAAFFLPETRGKSLEEIEGMFAGRGGQAQAGRAAGSS